MIRLREKVGVDEAAYLGTETKDIRLWKGKMLTTTGTM